MQRRAWRRRCLSRCLLITVDGLPRLTEIKSMKPLKREQSVMNLGQTAAVPCPKLHRGHSYDEAKKSQHIDFFSFFILLVLVFGSVR